jgi:hypothetical protein
MEGARCSESDCGVVVGRLRLRIVVVVVIVRRLEIRYIPSRKYLHLEVSFTSNHIDIDIGILVVSRSAELYPTQDLLQRTTSRAANPHLGARYLNAMGRPRRAWLLVRRV